MATTASVDTNQNVISGAPLTTDRASAILTSAIDRRVTLLRPMATPIDQISRLGEVRRCDSMRAEYYSVATKRTSVPLTSLKAGILHTEQDTAFEPSETFMIPGLTVTNANTGKTEDYVGYVKSRNSTGQLVVACLNPVASTAASVTCEGDDAADLNVIRMGRAAAELDVQTPQFEALPTKDYNYCQVFKAQVEQSIIQRLSSKEVMWRLSDQEEVAMIDLRLGIEKSFLFGVRQGSSVGANGERIYTTGGIWGQATRQKTVTTSTMTLEDMLDITREAFQGNCGSNKKVLICGTDFLARLEKVYSADKFVQLRVISKWSLEFREFTTNFGSLYIIHSDIFDECGHAGDAMIVDPDYLTKYVFMPMQSETLDLRRSGQRNTEAVVITEASCLVLRYPAAHMRIVNA